LTDSTYEAYALYDYAGGALSIRRS
jgi:hypothetical protein